MKLRTVKRLYHILLMAAAAVTVGAYHSWPLPVYLTVGMGLLLALGLLQQKYWRCPFCGKPLGKMNISPVLHCPHCRERIEA